MASPLTSDSPKETLNLPSFWKAYVAVLLSFLTSRLLAQTDLVMLAPLGAESTAAFAVPARLMVLDAIVAFALGPVVSVAVSRHKEDAQKQRHIITSALSLTGLLAALLTIVGLIVYPMLMPYFVHTPTVAELSREGLFWMTLSIPVRMLVFVSSMCLFACQKGKQVSYIYLVTLISNAALNDLLIYHLEFGFEGSYIATTLVSCIELLWLLYLVYREVDGLPFSRFEWNWLRSIQNAIGAEWIRLMFWQAEGLVILWMLAAHTEWASVLSVFGVSNEMTLLLTMPLIALMRASAMQLAAHAPNKKLVETLGLIGPVLKPSIIASVLLGLCLLLLAKPLGVHVYQLQDPERLAWWLVFATVFGLLLPVYTYSYLLRACYQACDMFTKITRIELLVTWLLFLPLLWGALLINSPYLFFSAYIGKEAVIALWLRISYQTQGALVTQPQET